MEKHVSQPQEKKGEGGDIWLSLRPNVLTREEKSIIFVGKVTPSLRVHLTS
jgi:hypothetical protein